MPEKLNFAKRSPPYYDRNNFCQKGEQFICNMPFVNFEKSVEENISVLRNAADTQTPLCGFMSEVKHDLW